MPCWHFLFLVFILPHNMQLRRSARDEALGRLGIVGTARKLGHHTLSLACDSPTTASLPGMSTSVALGSEKPNPIQRLSPPLRPSRPSSSMPSMTCDACMTTGE